MAKAKAEAEAHDLHRSSLRLPLSVTFLKPGEACPPPMRVGVRLRLGFRLRLRLRLEGRAVGSGIIILDK